MYWCFMIKPTHALLKFTTNSISSIISRESEVSVISDSKGLHTSSEYLNGKFVKRIDHFHI